MFNVVRFVLGERINKFKEEAAANRRAAAHVETAREVDDASSAVAASSVKVVPVISSASPRERPNSSKAVSTFGLSECTPSLPIQSFEAPASTYFLSRTHAQRAHSIHFLAISIAAVIASSDRYDIIFVVLLEAAFAVCTAVILAGPRLE